MKLVSVIIPMYNAENFIENAIKSILCQSYKNWELIIIDDGSKDNSLKICKEYEKNEKKIKVFSKENEGVSKARNFGAGKAKGDYIIFIDADDVCKKNMLERLVYLLEKNDADIVRGNYCICKNNICFPSDEKNLDRLYETEDLQNFIKNILTKKNHAYIWLLLIKRDLVSDFDERLYIFEDFKFYIDSLIKAKKVYVSSEELYVYCKDKNYNSLTKGNEFGVIQNFLLASKLISESLKNYKNYDENILMLNTKCILEIMYTFMKISAKNDFKQFKKYYDEIEALEAFSKLKANFDYKYLRTKEKIMMFLFLKNRKLFFRLSKSLRRGK